MSTACCPRSYAKTRRDCPRCGKPICHYCGVISRGGLVCAMCASLPTDPGSEEKATSVRFLAAIVAGVSGGVLGGLLCVGLTLLLGPWAIGVGILPGIGSRLGVKVVYRAWEGFRPPLVAAFGTFPGIFLMIWIAFTIGVNTAMRQAGIPGHVPMTDPRILHGLLDVFASGEMGAAYVGILLAVIAAAVPLRRR